MKPSVLAIPLLLAASAALAQAPIWERGRDDRYEVATAALGPGTTLGFFCSAYQVPNTAIISLHNLILGPQLQNGKNFDLRFVIDGQRFDLPGIAKDGELLVSPADANMELRVQEVTAALRIGKQAQIAVPAKAWKSKLPLDGADLALDGVFEKCW
ncbi:MAG TPA: hypothetical protein VFE34_09420 [Dongiaceae bacterium]|jgi:hypothetical protein|nr:hypothetical protein [Dongiaceae bacterium]